MKSDSRAGNLLPSGIVFSAISFVIGLGKPGLSRACWAGPGGAGQHGNAKSALGGLMALLGLLPALPDDRLASIA